MLRNLSRSRLIRLRGTIPLSQTLPALSYLYQTQSKLSTKPTSVVDQKKSAKTAEKTLDFEILKELSKHLWPSNDHPNAFSIKSRVVVSLGLLFGAKIVNICVPFLFKDIVDALPLLVQGGQATTSALELGSAIGSVPGAEVATVALALAPSTMVIGYGIARATAAGKTFTQTSRQI